MNLAQNIIDELRRAADKLTAEPHCGGVYSDCACDAAEELAALLRGLADNPVEVPASVLEMAVRINRAVADEPKPVEPVISDDARKILDVLNSFHVREHSNPDEAIDWAIRQPEVAGTDGPNTEGEYLVELLDFTTIEFDAKTRQWAVTVSDDAEAVTR